MRDAMRDVLTLPALAGGSLLVAEAVVSPWMEPHWGYHALNVPLSAFVLLAALGFLRRRVLGRASRVGAWIALVAAGVAVGGGLVPLAIEPTGLGASPGVVEGITHTFALALFLGLALLGLGAIRQPGRARVPLAVMGLGALASIVLVLVGYDNPWFFLVPEGLAGAGLAWAGLEAGPDPARGADATPG